MQSSWGTWLRSTVIVALVINISCWPLLSAHAENSISVALSSGPIVEQGESFSVAVTVNSAVAVDAVLLMTSVGRVTEDSSNGNLFRFTVELGPDTPIREWSVPATAILEDGTRLEAQPAKVQVEPDESFVSLKASIGALPLGYVGESRRLKIEGVTVDGASSSLIGSTRIGYHVANPGVVRVFSNVHQIVAACAGLTTMEISYRNERSGQVLTTSLSVEVMSHQRGDLNGEGYVNLDDYNIVASAVNESGTPYPIQVPNDDRDINKDGVIDGENLKEFLALCDNPNCNYRPLRDGEATPTPIIRPTATATPTPTPTPASTPTNAA